MGLNHVYKVIWSKTKHCYVVVSELAKRVGRNKVKAAVVQTGTVAAVLAVTTLTGSVAQAALNDPGTGSGDAVAWGTGSQATTTDSVAMGKGAKAENANAIAIGGASKSSGDSGIALGNQANAENKYTVAIGRESKASGDRNIALGYQATANKNFAIAIGAGASASQQNNAVAIGANAQANGATSVALGMRSKATGNDSYAIGLGSESIGETSIAFGNNSKASKAHDIVFGREANTRDQGSGYSIAIGYGAMSGTNKGGKNLNGGDAGGVAIGTGAYTGVNRTDISLNSSVAVGAGAGAGFRKLDAKNNNMPADNRTDVDSNDEVLKKAFGVKNVADYKLIAGGANGYTNVDINEATALGRNARAIGDQSVAIGAQTIAGHGAVALGGNDITQFANKKYYKSTKENFGVTETIDHNQDAKISDKTISDTYNDLVGTRLDTTYKATYAQDGSVVLGAQAHSSTPLGTALGTNALIRKGAFGATAIGAGSQVQANAEAAVAIGMGAFANGKYAVAAGTAANAEESAVAAGYKAKAEKSAVAVGDSSKATTSSVAVGQLAKAEKVADIAVGQGAVASGEQGAIAMGLGTKAQGDSSIMIGGSEITKVAAQTVNYQKEKRDAQGHTVIKTTKKTEHIGGEEIERTIRSVETEAATGSIQDAYRELTNGATLTTTTLDYSLPANKNGHGSISMGIHSLSTGDLGTAIGTGARVTKLGGVALGTGAISELQNGVAIGTGSKADANSIGTRQTDISYDKEGHIVPFDSKKVAYTFYWAGGTNTSEGDVVSFGTPGAERQLKNVAAGRIADDSTDAINGSQLNSVTKRMSSGWSVEGEKDHNSSGVLKLKGTEATGQSVNYADDGKSFTNGEAGTATGQIDKVRLNDEVKIRVGDNLVLNQEDTSRPVYEDPDNKNRQTGTRITSKFTYSLNPVLKNLTSATFKNDAGDTTVINGAGVTVTPVTTGKQPVSLTTSGLNNGSNAISNVAGNLPSTKNNTATKGASNATKSQEAPTLGTGTNQVNPTNAATVSDVLNAGWNLQGNNAAVDFVKPYDTVNFINGDGTTATVESADGKTSTVKYSVNLGDGLEKDATNKITVKAADKSLEANKDGVKVSPGDKSLETTTAGLTVKKADSSLETTTDGLKVKTDGKTITTDGTNGLKVITGDIEPVKTGADPGTNTGTVKVKDNDAGKIATVDSVVNAVNSAAWTATSGNAGTGTVTGTTAELIKAGNTVTFKAGDNLAIKQAGKEFIYSLNPVLSGLTSAEFKDGKNNTVNITPTGITITKPADTATNTPAKTVKLNQDGLDNGGNTITNVKSGLDTYGGNVPGTTDKNTGLVNLSKPTAGEPKVSDNTAATVGDIRNMGWIVSSNKTTGENGAVTTAEYSATVKNANEVKFVGEGSAIVSGKTEGNVRTITVKVDDQTSTNNAITPVVYTDENGNRVYPTGKTDDDGNQIFNTKPDGKGTTVTGPVKTTVNGPKGASTPTTLSNVEGNLVGAKTGTDAPTTSATAPTLGTGTNQVNKNNVATVGDVLQAGWNLQNNGTAKDFVKPYDTVNFVDGDGTTAVVETTTDQATSTVKYSVNLGNGLQKDTKGNTISVKPADKSLAVGTDGVKVNPGDTSLETTTAGLTVKKADSSLETTTDGLKVKTDGTTITTDGTKGLKVVTGTINNVTTGDTAGTVEAKTGDGDKIATVGNVVSAINNAAWTATSAATTAGELGATAKNQLIKAGDKVTFEADKNIKITQTGSKFTFTTKDNVSFTTVQIGGDQGPKLSKTADGNISVSDKDGTEPVKITNVQDGDISKTSKDAINGSQFHAVAKNTIKLASQNGTAAATETDGQSLDKTGGIKFTVKSSDGTLLDVAAAGDTITLTPKTGTITTGTDGVPTANTTDGKLVTADQLVTALTKMGWKATAGNEGTGTVTGNVATLVKAGETVTFKAGNNLAVKQDGKDFTYSLQKELTGLTSAEFKDANNNTVNITPTGITITKPADATGANGKTVTLSQDGLDNGGNAISNVASNLPSTKNSTTTNTATDPSNATKSQAAPNTTNKTGDNYVNPNNAATVGDVLNAGWNLQGNGTAVDFVKPYDTVNFIDGDGTTASVTSTDGKTSTVKYSVNLGNGLEKDANNNVTVKPADKSLTVGTDGVKVNPGDKSLETTTAGLTVKKADSSLETTTDGLKVKTDGTTITTDGTKGLKVVTGDIEPVTTGTTPGTVKVKDNDAGKIATVDTVAKAVNDAAWTATSGSAGTGTVTGTTAELIKAGNTVTFKAGDNLAIKQDGKNFIYSLNPALTGLTSAEFKDGKNNTVNITPEGITITKPADPTAGTPENTVTLNQNGLNNGGNPITNVTSNLINYNEPNVNGKAPVKNGLRNFDNNAVPDTNAATVGDLRNMGWVVSSNKTTGANGAVTTDEYSDTVKNANEVKFVGEGSAIVSGKTEGNVRTITVKVDNQTGINKTVTPVNYTKADGTKVYPQEVDNGDGTKTVKFFENPDGSGNEIPSTEVITSVNGPKGTTTPTTLSNIKSNLPDTKNNDATTGPSNATTAQAVPNTTNKDGDQYINPNNAATVGDVLNAGWNLQGDGAAVDFVKPYDTVNFVKGDGTSVTVESADGKTSTVKYSVNLGNGLEKDANNKIAVKAADGSISSTAGGISVNVDGTTIGKANDGTLQAITGAINEGTNGDLGKVVSNTGDGNKLATVNTVVNAINNAAWTANSEAEGTGTATGSSPELIKAGDIVVYKAGNNLAITQAGKNFTYSLKETLTGLTSAEFKDANKNTVNITPTGITITKPADTTTNTPEKNVKLNQDGLDNGGNAITNVKANLPETQNSNKANTVADPSNATKSQAAPNTTNKTGTDYINPNNAATVGDVLNAGWNLQGNGTAVDFVKPYDTVNFVNGLNTTAVVSTVDGKTSNVTYNVTGLPITYTDKDGNPVSKIGDKYYKVNDKGQPVDTNGNPSTKVNNEGKPVDDDGNVINPIDTTNNPVKTSLVNPTPETGKTGTSSPTTLDNVTSKLTNYDDPTVDGKTPVHNSLVDLSKPTDGSTPKVSDNTVATVGDLRNMGWIVSSDKNTDDLTKDYSDTVKNANEVKFVGEGTAIVSGKTDGNVRTITVKVDDQTSTNNAVTPVAYTKADGTQVYPTNKKDAQGNPIFNTKADGSGDEVPNTEVITSVNGPKGTTSPTTLKNVKNNIPNVNDGSKTITNTDGTEKPNAGDVANITKAPLTAAEAAELSNPKTADGAANPKYIGNNAATVSDVLNAGWNLQNNGTAKDFVKPYDTVNFVNGGNTTAVVTTNTEGTTSNVTFNVTGLPVATTINTNNGPVHLTKVGDNYYPVKGDGTPDIQTGADGHPTNGYVKANDGNYYPAGDVTYTTDPATNATTITPNANATPAKFGNTLTNPNVSNTDAAPNNSVSSPTSLGNVKNNLDSVNDGTEVITKPDGTVVNKKPNKENVTKGSITAEEAAKLANPKLADGSTNPNYVGNNAATVSDVLNAGFNVQGNGKAVDFVKPYDTVNFRDGGNTTVSVTTDDNLTTHVQVNVTGLPVTNTITDGNGKEVPVVKVGNTFYPANADGTPNIQKDATGNPTNGYVQANDGKVYPRADVDITNNADGTTTVVPKAGKTPTTVNTNAVNPNVANTDTNPGNTVNTPTTVGNIEGNLEGAKTGTTAPTTSATAPNTTNAAQPNYVNTHNAATVGDVLQAGWNLQGNGVAKDFVKPYDTVNFVNGGNTTAVVTTNVEGTASNVTFNVTGLPMTYTTADGTPVSKIGDKYYKVNDKGQPVDANGKPSTKVDANGQPLDENGTVIQPIDTATNPLHSTLVNPNVSNSDAEPNKQTTSPTQLGNVTSGLHKYGDTVDGKPVEGTTPSNTGLIDLSKPTTGNPKVSDNTAATVGDLRNMGWIVSSDKTTNDDGTAVGTGYTEQVKNANEVKFVGKGTAIVSGKTVDGVRTITVKVDDQVSTNNAIMPTSFTTKDGKKVYPVKDDAGNVTYHTTPDGKGTGDTTIDPSNVVTSVNGPKGTTTPTTLQNVKSNLPNVDDHKQKAFNPDGTEVTEAGTTTNTGNAKAPLSHTVVASMMSPYMTNDKGEFIDANGNVTTDPTQYVRNPNFAANNAATVGDVLQAGWNLQNNGTAKDFVKPYDTVNFINGRGTIAVVTTREGNTTSDVTFNVKAANGSVTVDEDGVKVTTGEITSNPNGSVAGPTDPATAKQLKDTLDAAVKELATAKDALKTAEKALEANPTDAALLKDVADKKADVAAKQTPVNDAQKAYDEAGLNKIATVQNVAEAINNSGFNLKTSEADGGKKLTGTKDDGELIKPGNTVEMVAGNNLTVKQDEHGKITYATKDDVTFKTVDTGTLNVGSPNTFTDGKGNTYTKVGENYYNPADVVDGAPKPGATSVTIPADVVVKPVSPVTMKAEAAKPATNNDVSNQPSSALNITSKDGKPTQITGVGSTLNKNVVTTTPEGTATKPGVAPKTEEVHLVDLKGTDAAPVNKNAAATVGDLQNMGWVVSTKDGNGYKDVVKNANVVDFKGGNGIEITGKTLTDGTREITVGIKEGEVTNKVTITHKNGTKTDAVKIGDNYYKVDKDGKPVGFEKDENGKPAGTPLTINPAEDKVTNKGAGFVTGNTVANAIQDSGWNVGKANISDVKKSDGTAVDFNKEAKVYDTVNPNDDVKFVDGANANVSMVTVDALNKDGTKKATTFVKVDVNRDLKIDSLTTGGTVVDKNGNNLVKVGDDYYKESDIDPVTKQPKANAKPVPPAKDGKDLVKVGDKYYEAGDVTVVTNPDGSTTATPKANAKPVSPAKDGEMIVKNADGKDVVSATVGKDGSGVFGVNGKDGKDGVSITAKDGEGAIGVNGKDGKNTSITGESISIKDKDNKNSTEIGINSVTLKDKDGNTSTRTADKSELIDKDGNTNTSTSTTITLEDKDKNTNTSTATGTTYTDKDKNTTTVGPKEIVLRDKDGNNTSKLTNNDLLLNTKDPNTGVEKTSHMSGDKIAFTTTDEIEKDSKGNPVIDPKTNQPKIKNPGNSTEYTNEGLKVIPNSTVARDANGNPTFLDKTGKPVMKDTDGKYKYVGQDGKPGKEYTGGSGSLKPNVVDTTRVISFGMDKPVLDANGNPVKGPDGKTVMTEGISAGMQQIHNVAPGTKDTDAVNVSQLKGMANVVMNVNNRVNRVGAQAAALAGLQSLQYDPLEPTQISAGLGYYKGAGALALGVNHFKNESTMFHMGASFNGRGDETMMNASVTWKFGARADETAVKDTFRQGPISASYTLQDKVSALEAQNQIQKDQLNELRATNAAQKAENEAQREELALMKAQIAELFKRMNG